MIINKASTSSCLLSFLAVSLLNGTASAASHGSERRRDISSSTITGGAPVPTLEPVIPPDVNQDSLSILALDPNVTLAWAGSVSAPGSDSRRRNLLKRDDGVYSQASLSFRYPVVSLDHSSLISDVSCSGGNTLTGTLSDNAYAFARKQWERASDIVFVTSVDGCGADNENDYFHADSVTFSDTDKTFIAKGSSAKFKDVAAHMNLKWGDVGSMDLKRAFDKREMFEYHSVYGRSSGSKPITWDYYLSRPDILGTDSSAPWKNAAMLAKWGKEGGTVNDAWKKGKVADQKSGIHKRSPSSSDQDDETLICPSADIEARAESPVDYGLALYCVECGFSGSATVWGEVDVLFSKFGKPTPKKVQVGFKDGEFRAGLDIGMVAYVSYEKDYSAKLARIPLSGFNIPLIVEVGPFVSVSVDAGVDISATGSMLIGTNMVWDNVDITLDLLSPSSSSGGQSMSLTPKLDPKVEASGQVKLDAKLALPFRLGVGISLVKGLWEAEAAIEDTPSIVAEGRFDVSSKVVNGQIQTNVKGGCYGIGWDIHLENKLRAVMEGDLVGSQQFDLMPTQKSKPIAEGCIGYVKESDGSGKPPATSPSKPTRPAACVPSSTATPNPNTGASRPTCKKITNLAKVADTLKLGKATKPKDVGMCALACWKDKRCNSFTFGNDKSCQLYSKVVKSLGVKITKGAPQLSFYDRGCYVPNTCKK